MQDVGTRDVLAVVHQMWALAIQSLNASVALAVTGAWSGALCGNV